MDISIATPIDRHPISHVAGARTIGADSLLAGVLDELDYGVMLLNAAGGLVHANDAACMLLERADVFSLVDAYPLPTDANQRRRWRALLEACAGKERRMDIFVSSRASLSVAVVPIAAASGIAEPATMLATFGRQRTCEPISLNAFARAHRLSATETRVLASLAAGHSPTRIADEHSVAISTVRTQIKQILAKTGGESIRDLLRQTSTLAPMRSKPLRALADRAQPY